MNHAELVEQVRKQAESLGEKDCSRAKADRFLAAICKAIFDGLTKDGLVSLPSIGRFVVETRAARKGTNPRTGQPITIPASKVMRVRVARQLREALNGKG